MTKQQILDKINEFIITNETQKISGEVLNSVLIEMTELIPDEMQIKASFGGVITPASTVSVTPGVSKWFFGPAGTYNNAGNITLSKTGILSYDGLIWKSEDLEIPKEGDFVMSTPEALSFELINSVWHLKILSGSIRFGNNLLAINNGIGQDLIIANSDFVYIYGNLTTHLIELFASAQSDPNLVFFGSTYPAFNIFAIKSAFLVNGKPNNIEIPKPKEESFVVTRAEWFNFVNNGNNWAVNIDSGVVYFGNKTTKVTNLSSLLIIDNSNYNYIYANLTDHKIYTSLDLMDSEDLIYVGVVFPAFNLFSLQCPFSVNGRPLNLPATATTSSLFNPAVDVPLVTNTIAFKNDEPTPFYKDSIFKSLDGGRKANLVLETYIAGKFHRYDIQNPTNLKASDIGASSRYVIEGDGYNRKIWKDITKVYKGSTANLPATLKMMVLQDSLGQGNANTNVAPIAIIKDLFATYGCAVTTCGTFNQDDGRGFRNDIISEGRGYWSLKSFTGKDNYPYDGPISISTGTGLTGKFENPFLRLANATDKANHPEWCFTNKVTNAGDPDGVSFDQNPNHSNYYIFDFQYYLTQHSVTVPDIIYMALGINDWQESLINVTDEFKCFQIMYLQIRAALPNVKLIITPTNGIMPENQEAWKTEMFPLAEKIVKYMETRQATDANLHICPIYTHVAKQNAGCVDLDPADLSENNNMRISTTWDVHVLDKESSKQEYMQVLEPIILALLN